VTAVGAWGFVSPASPMMPRYERVIDCCWISC